MAINIDHWNQEQSIPAIWRMPFRPFFLGIALYSCFAVVLWVIQYVQGIQLIDFLWHLHEMIIGFAATTVVGFVLTAAQTWTGVRALHGNRLALLFAVWLAGRLLALFPVPYSVAGALFDGIFFGLAGLVVGRQIWLAKNWRNSFFIAIFFILAVGSVVYAACLWRNDLLWARQLLMGAFFLIIHVVLVVGGRVIPFFTDRALQRPATHKPQWLELAALLSSLIFLSVYYVSDGWLVRVAAGAVVLANGLRWLNWKPWDSRGSAILWSLHLAYGFVVLGFAFLALNLPYSAAMHLLAIGGFGLMILAMISRVSLGHSGRALTLPPGFRWAYLAMVGAVVTRVLANLTEFYIELLWLTAVLWCIGFGLFLVCYVPILLAPRVDGKPG